MLTKLASGMSRSISLEKVFLALLFFLPFNDHLPWLRIYKGLLWLDLAFFLVMAWWLVRAWRQRERIDLFVGGLTLFLFWILALEALALTNTLVLSESLDNFLRQIYLAVLFLLTVNLVKSPRFLRLAVTALVLGMAVRVGYEVMGQYVLAWVSMDGPLGRLSSTNDLASVLVPSILVSIGLWSYFRDRSRNQALLFLTILLFFVLSLIMTRSKGGMVAVVLAVPIMLAHQRFRKPLLTLAMSFALIVGILYYTGIVSQYLDPVVDRFRNSDVSTLYRVELLQASFKMAMDHPLLGVGPDMYEIREPEYRFGRYASDPHNLYAMLAAEQGIPSLLGFLAFMGVLGIRIWYSIGLDGKDNTGSLRLGILAALCGILVNNLFTSIFFNGRYFWVFVGLCYALTTFSGGLSNESAADQTL